MIDSFQGEYRFLSNFWPCNIRYLGVDLPTNEHYYVCRKMNADLVTAKDLSYMNPGEVKRYAKGYKFASDVVKLYAMQNGLAQKFSKKNPELVQKLLDTGDQELVEGNTWGDRFWGVCDGEGLNHLGNLLMARRKELRNG